MNRILIIVDLKLLILLLILNCLNVCCRSVPYHDICGITNGRKIYIDLGETGSVSSKNFSTNSYSNSYTNNYENNRNKTTYNHCTLELITCPYCSIKVNFTYLNLTKQCYDKNSMFNSPCRCDYVWISEPPYEEKSAKSFCGIYPNRQQFLGYKSETRAIVITFVYSTIIHPYEFSLTFSSERNRKFINGSPAARKYGQNQTNTGTITSPYFPAFYSRDLTTEHIISCDESLSKNCQIRLIFTDFQLGSMSFIEFYDWNGQRLDVTTGGMFRPPVIFSNGPSLLIRFHANSGTGLGFKAIYTFFLTSYKDVSVTPSIDCGGFVENLGGAITMMNMIDDGVQSYDCIWLIRPPKSYLIKSHLYLKVVQFQNMGRNSELVIREGLTSDKLLLENIQYSSNINQDTQNELEHLTSANVGFYIHLRGIFTSKTRLAIAYTAFNYKDCFTGTDFVCHNHRCIPLHLSCDSFDHCGDNSDEPATCYRDWEMEPIDRRWYSHTPNYYFPKIERYPDIKTATLVFLISSLGLIALISALILLLYRLGSRTRQQRELQNQLQTISDLLDGNRIDDGPPDEPPVYEAPPDYDEIIKVGIHEALQKRRCKKRNSVHNNKTVDKRSRTLSSNRRRKSRTKKSTCKNMDRLEIRTDTPEISGCIPFIQNGSLGPSTSRGYRKHVVPDSPPPPYLSNTINSDISDPTPEIHSIFSKSNRDFDAKQNLPRKNFSFLRKCRSQDDILNMQTSNKFLNDENPSTSAANQSYLDPAEYCKGGAMKTVSDSNLMDMDFINEREKISGRNCKDYKAMKNYLENLLVRAKYPRKNYKPVMCNCEGACGCACTTENNIFRSNSDEILNGENDVQWKEEPKRRSHGRVRSADDNLLAKSFTIWKNFDFS